MSGPRTIDLAPPVERAFLVAVETGVGEGWSAEDSLAELASLADTAGAEVVGAEWQRRRHIDPAWYVGKGKAEELRIARAETGFTLLVADDDDVDHPGRIDPIGPCQARTPQSGSKSTPLRQTPQTRLRALRMQCPSAFMGLLPAARLCR